jgi:ATP-dependent Clp protease protease subunit
MKYIILILLAFLLFASAQSYGATAAPHQKIIGHVYLRGDFNDQMAAYVVDGITQLNAEGVDEIVLHITSPGGNVYSGLQIYDAMRLSKAPVDTMCEGYCMSMGAYLLSWGVVRSAAEHATIMFHQVSSNAQGKIRDIEADLVETKRLQQMMNDITREHSGMSEEDLEKVESFDNFMSPFKAKKLNLIDEVR